MISQEGVRDRALQQLVEEAEDAGEGDEDVSGSDSEEKWVDPLESLVYNYGWVSVRGRKESEDVNVILNSSIGDYEGFWES